MNSMAKILIATGLLITLFGIIIAVFGRIPGFGKLPGDIYIKKENFAFYFPLTTSILLSILLSFIFYLFSRR